ncbi:chaperone NapD [Thalassotalea aquiviva]|uniref:chaperone NapD n=1 Tax=Thalassotalea aquiviva TaxID=3242415 RepID=UPI00352AD313
MNSHQEYHVASFIAQVDPNQSDAVKACINDIPGAEIHAESATGKIVFTLEGSHQHEIGHRADQLKYKPGMLTLCPVYHQYIDESSE